MIIKTGGDTKGVVAVMPLGHHPKTKRKTFVHGFLVWISVLVFKCRLLCVCFVLCCLEVCEVLSECCVVLCCSGEELGMC